MGALAHASAVSAAGPAGGDTALALSYGGFLLGDMQLALPMAALREVVPLDGLQSLPCPAPGVIGGIDLRGVTVPVVDLRIVLGRGGPRVPHPSVIIMVHDGHILGLLADGVTGIFRAVDDRLHPVQVSGTVAAIYAGNLRREGDEVLVNVLAPAALAAWPDVPMVRDPEPARQLTGDAAVILEAPDELRHVMLMRAGAVYFAIDAMAVHATVSNPGLAPSVLARGGACRGVIDHGGCRIAAVDLLALTGLGAADRAVGQQAFVMRLAGGMVACLVDEVVDVVRLPARQVMRLPAFVLPRPGLFGGTVPASALPAEVVERLPHASLQFFLLDSAALAADEDVASLASVNTPGASSRGDEPASAASIRSDRRHMVTYALAAETATPIEQVKEILPFHGDLTRLDGMGPLLGVMANRGRSIPVLCLNRLTGGSPVATTPMASVLVVDCAGEPVGFAVQALKAIEPSDWTPDLPLMGRPSPGDPSTAPQARRLAQVGSGGRERMLPVLDLESIARGLQTSRFGA